MERLIRRIRAAENTGVQRLQNLSGGRRAYYAPTAEAVANYGPRATGEALIQLLRKLRKPGEHNPLTEKDVRAWKEFLLHTPTIFERVVSTQVTEQDFLTKESCAAYMRAALERNVHTNASFSVWFLGTISQMKSILRVASVKAWGEAGFYEAYEYLEGPGNNSLRREGASETLAYFCAYAIRTIEDYSYIEELLPIKKCIEALERGAVPVAYDTKRKTAYIANWYTL